MALLEVKDYSFAFPQSQNVLSSVNLTIEDGSFTVLLGANGSGKTTLLRRLHPILADTGTHEGEILWSGRPQRDEFAANRARIGFVQQRSQAQIVTDKVWHELAFGLENQGLEGNLIRQKVAEVATFFGIKDWFHANVSDLSGGQRQILNLASTMVLDPQLLILDEPTAQLDPISTDTFLQMLHRLNYELGITVLLAEHELHKILPFASQVLFMMDGSISLADSPREAVPQIALRYPQFMNALPLATQLFVTSPVTAVHETEMPLTIGEGRRWLSQVLETQGIMPHTTPMVSTQEAVLTDRTSRSDRTSPAITVRDVNFKFSPNEPDLLHDLNLTIHHGEIFALVGSNGSGKSTFMSILSGLRKPYRGTVVIEGKKLGSRKSANLYHHFLGVLPQDPQTLFVHETVFEDLADVSSPSTRAVTATNDERARIIAGAQALGIDGLLDRHPYDLSGGELQMAALFKILLLEPTVLLLDEPTKGLDETAKQRVIELITSLRNRGVTTVFVTHDIEFAARAADRAGLFFDGQVVSVSEVHEFFSTNNFYTTGASRIARDWFPTAITKEEVTACLRR